MAPPPMPQPQAHSVATNGGKACKQQQQQQLATASTSCPQSLAKTMSPLSLKDFELVSTVAKETGELSTDFQHNNVNLIRRKSDGRLLVWKRIHYGSMDEQELKMLLSELMVVRQIRHANIVEYVGRIVDEDGQDVYIVTEYCANGDLSGVIRKHIREGKYIPEQQIWKWLTQLSLALRCCHCRQGVKAVLHRDLKPANCFLDSDGNLKLGDFGLARVLRHSGSFASTFVGTPYYMSPEQMQKSAYTEKSDIWSLGIVAYELACLRPPFVADKQRDLASRIRRGEFEPPPECYSPALRTLIADCLSVNPDHRPTVEDLLRRPEMRCRMSPNDAPEASLRHWSDQLRELSDLLTAWQDSLTRQEAEMRRQESALAAAAAARQMELEKREARLDRLAKQLDERTRQLVELQDWLRQSGFRTTVGSSSVVSNQDNAMLMTTADCQSSDVCEDAPAEATPTRRQRKEDQQPDCSPSPAAVVSTTSWTIERGRDLSSALSNTVNFEDTLPVPSVASSRAATPDDSPLMMRRVVVGVCQADDLLPNCRLNQPMPAPPVPLPRRSVLQRNQRQLNVE